MSETLSSIISMGSRRGGEPALYLGLAGDSPRSPTGRVSLAGIDRIDIGRGKQRSIARRTADGAQLLTLELDDARLSSQHARITRLGAAWFVEDLQSKNGTWIAGRKVTRRPLADGDAVLVGHTMLVFREVGGEAGDLEGSPIALAAGFATFSTELAARFDELARAAKTVVPIEIVGETGTGKELAARAIHALSGRPGRFVAVNCGALAANLIEGELFGHRKGAYTGATDDRLGRVRDADGGTLFLDEIGELPQTSQAALLRVLQEGEVVPVGADRAIAVNLRIVTATHTDLDAAVTAETFRADLRARLLGVRLELPPLRRRREDLGMLISTLLGKLILDRTPAFSADAVSALYAYDWPLNIRELERALAGATAVAHDRIELPHLPTALQTPPVDPIEIEELTTEDRAIRQSLVAAIDRHGGNLAAVARELGKDRTQIRRWMKRFGLSRDD